MNGISLKGQSGSEPKEKKFSQVLPVINSHAAGIDIGDTVHDVAIFDGSSGYRVREFYSFTEDLQILVEWLKAEGITTAAIESTGVYWLTLYLMLEEAGIEPYLVNAKHTKNVTGRKKDDTDAIWLLKLHSCGLLQKSFQPEGKVRELRSYVRHRKSIIETASDSVRRMQKAMELMNLKLHTVISNILGKTGLNMVEAIIEGERDPEKLLQYKDPRIKSSDEIIKKSLQGVWRDEYLFMLEQSYEAYQFSQSQKKVCDSKIEAVLLEMAAEVLDGDISDLAQKKKPRKNGYGFDVRSLAKILFGVDVCMIDGISEVTALELISEIGTDVDNWSTSKQFTAWLNVVPNTKITGGKIISSKMQKKKNNAGQTMRMASCNLSRSKGPIGDYSRKMKARLGKKGGVVATAHKISKILYAMIKEQKEFDQNMLLVEQEKAKQKKIQNLEKQLEKLKRAS